jgi:hypothetical protein
MADTATKPTDSVNDPGQLPDPQPVAEDDFLPTPDAPATAVTEEVKDQAPSQPPQPQPEGQDLNDLYAEAASYGINLATAKTMDPEQIRDVMAGFDANLIGPSTPPFGMNAQLPPQQPQPQPQQPVGYQQPPSVPAPVNGQAQQLPATPPEVPLPINDWENENVMEKPVGDSFKAIHAQNQALRQQVQQMEQQVQAVQYVQDQLRQEEVLNRANTLVDNLDDDAFGKGWTLSPQQQFNRQQLMQQAASLESAYAQRGINASMGQIIERAARAMNHQSLGDLSRQAEQRNKQIAGTPSRTANTEPLSVQQKVQGMLDEMQAQDTDGFLE